MTVEDELNLLDEGVRKLKLEYDIYFGGGAKRPPNHTEWRVQSLIKRLETNKLTFAQRFKYNSILQKFAVYSDLWRQKLKIREEGYRRPQDALLAIQGVRGDSAATGAPSQGGQDGGKSQPFRIACSNPEMEEEKVRSLFTAMAAAKRRAGEDVTDSHFESFRTFVENKTKQIRQEYGCQAVEYAVEVKDGKVLLKAKAGS